MKTMQIGAWPINVGEGRGISSSTTKTIGDFLTDAWVPAVLDGVKHPWRGITDFGVPSPIVRVDMAPELNGGNIDKSIFEVETRPAALGILLSLLPQRIPYWKAILNDFGCMGFVKLGSSNVQDDVIAAQLLDLPYSETIPDGFGPYWIRAGNGDGQDMEKLSLVPIIEDGDKSYLIRLGLARTLPIDDLENGIWENPFVTKPLIGSHMDGVHIFNKKYIKGSLRGSSTQKKIVEEVGSQIQNGRKYLIQPYIHPLEEMIEENKGFTMWRLFYGWQNGHYQFIGGLWNWANTLRVHGGTHAAWGPVDY
jgi:hypothetical protein